MLRRAALLPSLAALAVLLSGAEARAEKCTVKFDPSKVSIGWVGYKYTTKMPVRGRFSQYTLTGPTSGASLPELLAKQEAKIDVLSLDSDSAERNANLLDAFFMKLGDQMRVDGKIEKVKGDDTSGEFTLRLRMNGKTRPIQMNYTYDSGVFDAQGTFDYVKEFGLKKLFDELAVLCKNIHKGRDGVPKTWPDGMVTLSVPVERTCH